MRLSRHLCLSLVAVLLHAGLAQAEEPHWGRLYVAAGNVPVRENPSPTALKVRVLKPGQKIRADYEDDGWAAVFDPKEPVRSELRALGYARVEELRPGGPLLAQASSIEVRKSGPEAKPEVVINGKPVKPASKSADKPEPKKSKPEAKPKAAAGKDFGEIRVADRPLTVRAGRDKETEFKRLLRPGQRVRVDFLEDGWFAVFDPDEKTRDLSKALGYSRDKYLVPEGSYAGPPPEPVAPKAGHPAGAAPTALAAPTASTAPQAPQAKAQKPKAEDPDVGYSVLERKDNRRKPVSTTTLRVRLDLTKPPAADALRKIVREIWKAERKKNEDLQLEVLLTGMDAHGLAYAVAKFHDDGRLREFWWRDVVLGKSQ